MSTTRRTFFGFSSLALAAAFVVGPAYAEQELLPAQSQIGFVSRQMGVPVEGEFKKFDAQIAFDPKQPQAATLEFTIDMKSATLGIAQTDAELVKPEWFDVKKHPSARFKSSSVTALGGNKFEVAGTLQIKGESRDVVVPVTLTQSAGATTTATGSFTIKRLDYRIGVGDWKDTSMVADPVEIAFKLTLSGVALP